jgi:hypothetical protein
LHMTAQVEALYGKSISMFMAHMMYTVPVLSKLHDLYDNTTDCVQYIYYEPKAL